MMKVLSLLRVEVEIAHAQRCPHLWSALCRVSLREGARQRVLACRVLALVV